MVWVLYTTSIVEESQQVKKMVVQVRILSRVIWEVLAEDLR
jgi:hypothetical protein